MSVDMKQRAGTLLVSARCYGAYLDCIWYKLLARSTKAL